MFGLGWSTGKSTGIFCSLRGLGNDLNWNEHGQFEAHLLWSSFEPWPLSCCLKVIIQSAGQVNPEWSYHQVKVRGQQHWLYDVKMDWCAWPVLIRNRELFGHQLPLVWGEVQTSKVNYVETLPDNVIHVSSWTNLISWPCIWQLKCCWFGTVV
jgi:hypothetical protein